MTFLQMLLILALIAMLAYLSDHFGRLQRMGVVATPPEHRRARSVLDPAGSALGELGRADAPHRVIASVLGTVAKFSEMAFAPIGMVLNAISKASEMLFNPIGMVLGVVGGAKRR